MKNFAPTLSQIQPAPVGKPFRAYGQDELRKAIEKAYPFTPTRWCKPVYKRSSTIKDAVCEVMADGLERSSAEIIKDAEVIGVKIRPTSLSSTLSRLVDSGLIERRGESTYKRTFIWVGEISE